MPDFLLCASSDPHYWEPYAVPFLESLESNWPYPSQFTLVGFTKTPDVSKFRRTYFHTLGRRDLEFKTQNFDLQMGEFLKLARSMATSSTLLLKVDADMIMQRPPDEAELAFLDRDWDNKIGLSFNDGPLDGLAGEAERIKPQITPAQLQRLLSLIPRNPVPIRNCGVIVTNVRTYLGIYHECQYLWPFVDAIFGHYAKTQWCMMYAVHKLGLEVVDLPLSFHLHHSYMLPQPVLELPDGVYYDGKKVLFHHI